MRLIRPLAALVGALAASTGVLATPAAATPEANPAVAVADVSVLEGTGGTRSAVFTLSIGAFAGAGKKVTVATANGSATTPKDYAAVASTVVTFNSINGQASVSVPITTDASLEANETFRLLLSAPVGVTIPDSQAVATIVDDEQRTISIANASVTEGNSGTKDLSFNITLNKAAAVATTVQVSTANGTAVAPSDFTALTSAPVTFNVGATSATAKVTIKGDSAIEPNENLTVNLAPQSSFLVGDGSAVGTILNDDAGGVSISIGDVTLAEPNAGQVAMRFPLTLSAPNPATTTINVTTTSGSAVGGSDFAGPSTISVNLPTGATSATALVAINGDTVVEGTETFTATITDLGSLVAGDVTAIGTIVDNDATPVISVADASIVEGDSGSQNVALTVSLDRPAPALRNGSYRTVSGTAGSGDFTPAPSGGFTLAAFASEATITIPILGDTVAENTESFTVELVNLAGATAGDVTATVTITDNDGSPNTISVADVTVVEGTGSGSTQATITVNFGQATTGNEQFRLSSSNGTAVVNADYLAVDSSTSVAAGLLSRTFSVTIVRDAVDENDEQFNLLLTDLIGFTPADDAAVVTITDDDGPALPAASIADVSITEGDSGTTGATATVTLSAPAPGPISVQVTSASGTATTGTDFTPVTRTVNFSAGETQVGIPLQVSGDTTVEPDETFTITLSSPQGLTIGDGSATVTITNDDSGGGGLRITSISNPSIVEGNSGTKALNFTVFLSGVATGTETFVISTANGTASAGSDYVARSNVTITIPAGNTQRNVTITINGDTAAEANETLLLNILSAIGLTIDDNQATGTITNDD